MGIVAVIASTISVAWSWSSYMLYLAKSRAPERFERMTVLRRIAAELRPFFLPAATFVLVHDLFTGPAWACVFDAIALSGWWVLKDVDDDDRWKRRRKKVAEKVKALASGRLVAVPT